MIDRRMNQRTLGRRSRRPKSAFHELSVFSVAVACNNVCLSTSLQSMVAFLKDPEGAPLWEEDPEAKDIVHIDSEKVTNLNKTTRTCQMLNRWLSQT